jgi:serine/threonine protein kinase
MTGRTITHYRILERLGEGAMGVVYKAEDERLRRTVALKFLNPQSFASDEEKKRFLREAQAGAMLDHPNVATVYGVEETDGEIFIVMAWIDGPSVAGKLLFGSLPADEALDIAIQSGQGLQEAHEKGIVHRDVKPSNVMISQKGQAKITDFGLAQMSGRSRLTRTGTTMGTPSYMSPEQALGKPTDRRCDIWSLAVMLYEMLAGRAPFDGAHEQVIVYSIINEDHEPVTTRRAGLPAELDRVLAKALAKNPAERYQHVDEFLVDLRAVRKKMHPPRADTAEPPATRTPATRAPAAQASAAQALSAQFPEAKRHSPLPPAISPSPAARRRLLLALAVLAAVASLLAWWLWARQA